MSAASFGRDSRAAQLTTSAITTHDALCTSAVITEIPYIDWTAGQQLFSDRSSVLNNLVVWALQKSSRIWTPSAPDPPTQNGGIFSAAPPWFTTVGVTVSHSQATDMAVWTLRSATPSDKVVVAIHGGGYVNDPSILHWRTYSAMALRTRATVVVPMYPLVLEGGTAEKAVPQIVDFLADMVVTYGADNVSVLGDSAGGGLALAAMQELVSEGRSTPAHLVLLSPWLDITLEDPAIRQINDPITSGLHADLQIVGQQWAGDLGTRHPWASPLYGSLDGLPPTAAYAGSLDGIAPDVLRLRAVAIESNADMTFVLRAGQFHVWPLAAPLPDAVAALRSIDSQLGISRPIRPRRLSV